MIGLAPSFRRGAWTLVLGATFVISAVPPANAITVPPGFVLDDAFGPETFSSPVQIVFMPDGRKLVVEQGGDVWVMSTPAVRQPTPFIDLTRRVLCRDGRGLLGVALDPDFSTNHWVYFSYTVDPDSNGVDTDDEAYARIERYQESVINPDVIDTTTRQVLIGTDWAHGIASADPYHTIGALRFGADKSLLVSSGDGAHFDVTDAGGNDPNQFLPGRTDPAMDIGSFRSQTLNSLCGKILRIDKETGWGLPSNPYWDGNPVSPRSRSFVYGVRNPYRFVVRPGTGSTNPADGHPGTLYIGDTGWNDYDTDHVATGGENFGWPCIEGPGPQPHYQAIVATAAGDTNVLCGAAASTENPTPYSSSPLWWSHTNSALSNPAGWTGHATVGGTFETGGTYRLPTRMPSTPWTSVKAGFAMSSSTAPIT
jgi:glucose/arabinose dehydrogenase